jgi:hypothetical protein
VRFPEGALPFPIRKAKLDTCPRHWPTVGQIKTHLAVSRDPTAIIHGRSHQPLGDLTGDSMPDATLPNPKWASRYDSNHCSADMAVTDAEVMLGGSPTDDAFALVNNRPADATLHARPADTQRTQMINTPRAHFVEFGIAAVEGRNGTKELLAIPADGWESLQMRDARLLPKAFRPVSRFRSLGRTGAQTRFDRRQTETWSFLQATRALLAAFSLSALIGPASR